MNKAEALHLFWSSFDMPAITENSAYDERVMEEFGNPDLYIRHDLPPHRQDRLPQILAVPKSDTGYL